ncbi:hypothetical protein L596_005223 [Steinernema carpocapsae]|uniref:Uncharacterized protein n=1 Tax=Steinernema carpocapsae TaxID=34508 RepID=A0A4V6I8K4_STECR|nr:hypothetical protein L596_005223 [Steinernema carpocapsae]
MFRTATAITEWKQELWSQRASIGDSPSICENSLTNHVATAVTIVQCHPRVVRKVLSPMFWRKEPTDTAAASFVLVLFRNVCSRLGQTF